MRAFIPSETALVLGGGGAKGAYEVGAIAALDALGVKAGSVFGTSVGALHAAMYAQGSMDAAAELWSSIRLSDVVSEESLAIADDAETSSITRKSCWNSSPATHTRRAWTFPR